MTIISDVGCDVTVREITRTYNDYGDATETNSDSTITAWVVPASCDDLDLKSGILKDTNTEDSSSLGFVQDKGRQQDSIRRKLVCYKECGSDIYI